MGAIQFYFARIHNFGKKLTILHFVDRNHLVFLLLVPQIIHKADLGNPNSFAINLITCLLALPSYGAFLMRTRFEGAFRVTWIGRVDFPELSH